MKSIKARFLESENKNPYSGAFIHLVRAVEHQGFSRKALVKAFKKLMPKEEYEKTETKGLIDYLEQRTKPPEEVEKETKTTFRPMLLVKSEVQLT